MSQAAGRVPASAWLTTREGTQALSLPAASDSRLSPPSLPFLRGKTVKATVWSCLFNEGNSFSHLAILKEGREIAAFGASTKDAPPLHFNGR